MRLFTRLLKFIFYGLFFFILAVLVRTFIVEPIAIEGASMNPTLHDSELVLSSPIPYYFHDPKQGDIVIFTAPDKDAIYIKRVIGEEDQTVDIKNSKYYIDNKVLSEPYITEETLPLNGYHWSVPDDHVFVSGDNRTNSTDSRVFGPIANERIRGKVILRIKPFSLL